MAVWEQLEACRKLGYLGNAPRGERPASESDAKKGREAAGQALALAATLPLNSLREVPGFHRRSIRQKTPRRRLALT